VTPILVAGGLTLLASFLCSLFEAALYAVRPAQLEVLRERGVRGAARLARLREDIEEPIAAILTVNTIAHTIGAAWCGAMVGERYGGAAVGIFAAVFTALVLLVTEIVPKSVGVRYAAAIGPKVAGPIQALIWTTWPLVKVVKALMRLVGGGHGTPVPSEDELVVLSRQAARGGAVRADEHRWVKGALTLDRLTAGELRTPRTVVESLAADTLVVDLLGRLDTWVHSRVPVTEGDQPDRVIGMVHRRDLLDAALHGPPEDLRVRDKLRPIPFVPETMPANDLLDLFIEQRTHMAAVVDEYGGFEGVVTLEDVLECMLGAQIVDEHDRVDDLKAHAKERGQRLGGVEGPTDPA